MTGFFQDADGKQPLKAAFSNGHVPLYVDEEGSLNQSTIILSTLARRAGLMGESEAESRAIELVMAHCYDDNVPLERYVNG